MPRLSLLRRSGPSRFGAALLFLVANYAFALEPAEIASQGGSSGVLPCASCHGADGAGVGSMPRLAGMDADYLNKQLGDFMNGTRESAVMAPVAVALGQDGRRAMSDYYAALPFPDTAQASAAAKAADAAAGARLALHGDWDRGIPACVQCHGPQGVGVGSHFPALAGQSADYIVTELRAWKTGVRRNDPLQLMRHLAAQLSDDEMREVAAWFARQPAANTKVAP